MKTKTVPFLFVVMLFAIILAGCSADNLHYDDRAYHSGYMNVGANEQHFAIVNLGADNVYVGNFGIKIPENIDANLISNVNAIYMGDLHDVLNLGFWNCETEIEKKLMWFGFPSVNDIRAFLVFELLSSDNELLGHSITNSPIWNANTHECYEIEFIEIETVNV